jgi:hypothetical protein
MRYLIILSILFIFFSLTAVEPTETTLQFFIPDSTQVQIITLENESTYMGRIIEIGDNVVNFETKHGVLSFSITEIVNLELVFEDEIKEGKYWFPNPNSTRLFFAPTARMLKQGEGYFADYWIFFPTINYGITDHISFGGGFSLLPGIRIDEQILFFTPKVGLIEEEKFNMAIGTLALAIPSEKTSLGILYAVSTYGSMDHSLTGGIGYGYVDGDLGDKPMLVFGGETRTGRSTALVSENWLIPGLDRPFFSAGLRFFGKKLSADFALVLITENELTVFPYIDFIYKFK